MTQVLLINPPYSFTEIVKLKNKREKGGFYVSYPHLGLCYLSSFLKKEGFTVEILDASVEMLDVTEIARLVKDKNPAITGITVTTPLLKTVYSIVSAIRGENINTEIVLGGSHISIDPEIIKELNVKYGFIGEAESGLTALCNKIIKGKGNFKDIEGLVYNDKGEYFVNKRNFINKLDSLPFPDRDLIDNDKYFSPVISGRITSMITARGCPFNCSYCSRPAIGRGYRIRGINNIIDEIKEVVERYNVRYINFEDDTFTLNKERTRKLCEEVLKRNINILWGCQTRADLVTYDLLVLMKKSGCMKISFGIETGSERVRDIINKRVKNEMYVKAFNWCNELGIETNAYIMFGHPTETVKEMEESISFTCKLAPTYAAFYITTILPGSILCEEAVKEGKLKHPDIWRKYMKGEVDLPSYVPQGLNKEFLDKMLKKAFRKFYLRIGYILSRLKKIKNFSDLKRNLKSAWVVLRDYIF